jgi:hypothetical protein
MMLVLAEIGVLLLTFVNAFGAWMVSRRKPWIAGLFMLAAALLAVAFGGIIGFFPYIRVILVAGLVLSWLASFLNAHIVLGNVVWRFHLIRAAVAIGVYILAHYGLG